MTLEAEIRRVAGLRPLLVAVDFDGTITPLVDDPSRSRPDPEAVAALARIAEHPEVSVAVVSGRKREELLTLLGEPPGVTLIGEHGSDSGEDQEEGPDLGGLVGELEEIASTVPGSWVEAKVWSVVFHYRQADPLEAAAGVRQVLKGPGSGSGITVRKGHMVVELHAADTDKGDAIEGLRESTGAAAVVFVGDDVTDEDVFARLGEEDLGIKVGMDPSAARHRVEDVAAVARLLRDLADTL